MSYFFVSQRQTYKEEHSQGYLWAPRDGIWHHETMSKVKKGDAIIQYTGKIVGIGIALGDNYNFDRPDGDGFQKWDEKGYKVDVEQFHFVTPVEKDLIKKTLLENQPKDYAPLNVNGDVKQGYLFSANEVMVDIILKNALEIDQSSEQKEIVEKIQKKLSIDLSGNDKGEPEKGQDKMGKYDSTQKIFFGAPGTGKSYKVRSILAQYRPASGDIRRKLFIASDTAKKNHYAEVLDNEEKFGCNIWDIDDGALLNQKLSEVKTHNDVVNPEHSALQAYIKFLSNYTYEQRVFRTTFHPDYDYAQFVGTYKPKRAGNVITYAFVPQIFAKAYVAAWKKYLQAGSVSTIANQVYLVIEEINRGNCAQIFGDIFQLLDRVDDGPNKGFSQYPIDADNDFVEWLAHDDDGLKYNWKDYINDSHIRANKLVLPPNLNILATMNTSDQSLFPMDSAFKRRFEWEYVPIKYAKDADCGENWKADEFKIDVNGSTYMWLDFLKKVNADIYDATQSEDKQMGEFFIKPKNDETIRFEDFRSKVLFYLWDSVYKDETDRKKVFFFEYNAEITKVTFQSLFGKDGEGIVKKIMENLGVKEVNG